MNKLDCLLLCYDQSEKGKKNRRDHKYKKISQVGSVVEYEYQECDDKDCACHVEASRDPE